MASWTSKKASPQVWKIEDGIIAAIRIADHNEELWKVASVHARSIANTPVGVFEKIPITAVCNYRTDRNVEGRHWEEADIVKSWA